MGVYNSISNIQRIAFIDKLTDAQASSLSTQYPFAICYASENSSNDSTWLPGFWKAGKRFGIQKIDTTHLDLNGYEVWLTLENNVLKLKSTRTNINIVSISVIPSSASLNVNETVQLHVVFNPTNATAQSVTWSSSNTDIATVSSSGLVTAKSVTYQGAMAMITATSSEGQQGQCAVYVRPISTDKLFYIGNDSYTGRSSIDVTTNDIDNDIYNYGWHKIDDQLEMTNGYYSYEATPFTRSYSTIIIPANYGFYIPFFDESDNRLEDTDFKDLANNPSLLSVNGEEYKVYTFLSSNIQNGFINSILPI